MRIIMRIIFALENIRCWRNFEILAKPKYKHTHTLHIYIYDGTKTITTLTVTLTDLNTQTSPRLSPIHRVLLLWNCVKLLAIQLNAQSTKQYRNRERNGESGFLRAECRHSNKATNITVLLQACVCVSV